MVHFNLSDDNSGLSVQTRSSAKQAYTSLIRFIILLHKVAYDYVTLLDVYACAIDPELLEKRIKEADEKLAPRASLFLSPETYAANVSELKSLGFVFDEARGVFRAIESEESRAVLAQIGVTPENLT